MTINNPSISTTPVEDSQGTAVIEMLQDPPIVNKPFTPPRIPGQLAGYYNGSAGEVLLYVVNAAGTAWVRCI